MAVFEKGFAVTRLAAFLRLTGEDFPIHWGSLEHTRWFNLAAEPFAENEINPLNDSFKTRSSPPEPRL